MARKPKTSDNGKLIEAIKHLDEVLSDKTKTWNCKCKKEHKQLREWLDELLNLRVMIDSMFKKQSHMSNLVKMTIKAIDDGSNTAYNCDRFKGVGTAWDAVKTWLVETQSEEYVKTALFMGDDWEPAKFEWSLICQWLLSPCKKPKEQNEQ